MKLKVLWFIEPMNRKIRGCSRGPHNKFELSWQRIIKEFGKYFVVLPARNIERYADLIRNHTREDVRYGTMKYSSDQLNHSLTCKDSIEDKTLPLSRLNSLLEEVECMKITSPIGKVRYCSQGMGEVVVSQTSPQIA